MAIVTISPVDRALKALGEAYSKEFIVPDGTSIAAIELRFPNGQIRRVELGAPIGGLVPFSGRDGVWSATTQAVAGLSPTTVS